MYEFHINFSDFITHFHHWYTDYDLRLSVVTWDIKNPSEVTYSSLTRDDSIESKPNRRPLLFSGKYNYLWRTHFRISVLNHTVMWLFIMSMEDIVLHEEFNISILPTLLLFETVTPFYRTWTILSFILRKYPKINNRQKKNTKINWIMYC